MKYSRFFYCLNLKVKPFKGFMLDLSKFPMLEHVSIDPFLDFSIWLCWTTKWPNLWTFFGFSIVFIQLSLFRVIFHLKFKIFIKVRKSPLFPLNKVKIEKWLLLRPILADLAALWNLRVWDPYQSFKPTFIKFWDLCSGNIIGMAPTGSVKTPITTWLAVKKTTEKQMSIKKCHMPNYFVASRRKYQSVGNTTT